MQIDRDLTLLGVSTELSPSDIGELDQHAGVLDHALLVEMRELIIVEINLLHELRIEQVLRNVGIEPTAD